MRTTFAVVSLLLTLSDARAGDGEKRLWTDNSGKFRIEATFVDVKDYQVTLSKGGNPIEIPLSRLSKADQEFVKDALWERDQISDEVLQVFEIFEEARAKALASLESAQKGAASAASAAANNEELRTLDFYRDNPALFRTPGGFREHSEEIRARGRKQADSQKKHYENEKSKAARTMTVPRVRYQDVDGTIGLKSIGLYVGTFTVERAISTDFVLVRASDEENSRDFAIKFCLKQAGGAKPGRIALDSRLYYITGRKEVPFPDTGTTVNLCVVEPYPHSLKELQAAWAKWRPQRQAPQEIDPEREARRRFDIGKTLLQKNKVSGHEKLKEVMRKFPGTRAAADAQQLVAGSSGTKTP